MQRPEYAVFLGLDVGKEEHHACGLNPDGDRLHDKALPQSEARIRETLASLAQHGRVVVVIDQPASIGALPVTVARSLGIEVAYLPGLAMRRIAHLHPGNAKTDARDAYVIAEAARSRPHPPECLGDLVDQLLVAARSSFLVAAMTRPAALPRPCWPPNRLRNPAAGGMLNVRSRTPSRA